MKKFIEKLIAMLKTKNVELTSEEQTALFTDIFDSIQENKPIPQDIKIPDNLQHNASFIKELQAAFQAQTEAAAKKYQEQIDALMASNASLEKMIGEERQKREDGLKAIEEKNKQTRAAEITNIIADMIKAEKIPANNEEAKTRYQKLLETDYETAKAVIDALPGKTAEAPKNVTGTNTGAPVQHTGLASIVNPQILQRLDTQKAFN